MKETTIMFEKGYKKAKRERMGTCESKKKRQKIKMKGTGHHRDKSLGAKSQL